MEGGEDEGDRYVLESIPVFATISAMSLVGKIGGVDGAQFTVFLCRDHWMGGDSWGWEIIWKQGRFGWVLVVPGALVWMIGTCLDTGWFF